MQGRSVEGRDRGGEHGTCSLCGREVDFHVLPGAGLREARCPACGGSRRNRDLARAIVQSTVGDPSMSLSDVLGRIGHLAIFEAQASGPLHRVLRDLPGYVCSEYYPGVPPGTCSDTGIRCEDLEKLSFPDHSFDLVITQDVFEHLRHPERAFLEIDRVLKPGGHHLFTVPLHEGRRTVRRVHCLEEEEYRLLPPVYHGDPLRKTGSLVYTDFGDDILEYLESLGIRTEICVRECFYPQEEISWIQEEACYRRYEQFRERGEIVKFFRYNSVVFRSRKHEGRPVKRPTFTGERFLPWISGYPVMSYEHLHRYRLAAELVQGKKVLDMGCGEGYGAQMLARRAASVLAVDVDPEILRHAAARRFRRNLKFLSASITQLPIRQYGQFDVIVCYEALEHIADHAGLMAEVKRLLRKDGLLILSTPNTRFYSPSSAGRNPYHVKELDFDQFKTLLQASFAQVLLYGQKVYPSSWIFPLDEEAGRTCDFAVAREGGAYAFVPGKSREPRYFIAMASDVPVPNRERLGPSHLCDLSETAMRDKEARIAGLRRDVRRIDADRARCETLLREKDKTVRNPEGRWKGTDVRIERKARPMLANTETNPRGAVSSHSPGVDTSGNRTASVAVCPNPVFVVGCPRSGTSVLSHSLARHSMLWLGEESDFMAPLIRSVREMHAFATRRGKFQWLSSQEVGVEEFLQYIGLGVNALYLQRSGGLRWVEQTPQYTLWLPDLAVMFPGARFIHIARNAGDVVLSMTRSGFEAPWANDFEEACRTWVRFVEAALAFEAENPDRVLTVQHEALVRDRRTGFERILRFLDLPYEEPVAEFLGSTRINSSFGGSGQERPRWEELFSAAQQTSLFERCGDLLTRLGYRGQAGKTADSVATAGLERPPPQDASPLLAENLMLKGELQTLTERIEALAARAPRLIEMGERLFSNGQVDAALELFRSLAVLVPQSALNWNNLGVSLLETGQRAEAIGAFRKALEIDGSFELALDNYRRIAGPSSEARVNGHPQEG